MNENDLRVQRTRNLLQQALIELISSKGYEEISVRDLTQRAQVGYRTFFHHYENKDALLHSIIDGTLQEFMQSRIAPGTPDAAEKNTLALLEFVEARADIFLLLLRTSAAEQLVAAGYELGMAEGSQFFRGTNMPEQLVAHHFASSMIGFMRWWLENGMPFPAVEMAEYANRLIVRPILKLTETG